MYTRRTMRIEMKIATILARDTDNNLSAHHQLTRTKALEFYYIFYSNHWYVFGQKTLLCVAHFHSVAHTILFGRRIRERQEALYSSHHTLYSRQSELSRIERFHFSKYVPTSSIIYSSPNFSYLHIYTFMYIYCMCVCNLLSACIYTYILSA